MLMGAFEPQIDLFGLSPADKQALMTAFDKMIASGGTPEEDDGMAVDKPAFGTNPVQPTEYKGSVTGAIRRQEMGDLGSKRTTRLNTMQAALKLRQLIEEMRKAYKGRPSTLLRQAEGIFEQKPSADELNKLIDQINRALGK